MIVAGGRFTEEDTRWVIDALLLKRDPDSFAAAAAIKVALEFGIDEAELTPRGEAAVATVLQEAWRPLNHDPGRGVLIHGVAIRERDAHTLIDLLTREGETHEDLAAAAIEYALAERLPSVDLSDTCLEAILGVLDDPPEPLCGLQRVLLEDIERRRRGGLEPDHARQSRRQSNHRRDQLA